MKHTGIFMNPILSQAKWLNNKFDKSNIIKIKQINWLYTYIHIRTYLHLIYDDI